MGTVGRRLRRAQDTFDGSKTHPLVPAVEIGHHRGMRRGVVMAVATVLGVACTPTGRKSPEQASPQTTHAVNIDRSQAPVVVTLQTRDHEVAVYSVEGKLEFTIALHGSGAVLAERIDEQEFAKGFPGIHQHFRTAFADEAGEAGAWAGL
jgi:hypothetical protein